MRIIIPMAGRGSRLRPHTLTVPKPLIPIAGKPIVQRLVEDIVDLYGGKVEEIAFIIGDFGDQVEKDLIAVAEKMGAKGTICYQDQPLGTAHAIWMAKDSLEGEVIVAFADTLFRADFKLDRTKDGAIWVKAVDNPSAFGVVTLNDDGIIDKMVEKPTEYVSNLAIIGIYYLREGEVLREEIRHLIDNNITGKGEFQLTDALENMKNKGAQLVPGEVKDWMDCGNKHAVLETNQKILSYDQETAKPLVAASARMTNSVVIPPCFIGEDVVLENAVVGPYVSIGHNTQVRNSVMKMTLVQNNTQVENVVLDNSMIGNSAEIVPQAKNFDLGDFSRIVSQ